MKKFYLALFLLTFAFKLSYGSHASGADLTYDYLGNGQYRIVLKFYRDCSGISAPTSPIIDINSASCGVSTSLTLTQQSFQEVTPLCPTATSTCNGGSTPGLQQYIYTGIITLQQCTDWVFSFAECCRNSAITNSTTPDSYDLYVEATLNNVLAPTNSSPDFSNPPVPFICANQPFSYNDGVVDINGNTLVYSLIDPRTDASTNVPYAGGFSPSYPISSTGPFNFNTTNGQMAFTPNATQQGIVTVKVTEYNSSGQVIGSVIRDMQLIVINCSNTPPVVTAPLNVTGGTYNTTTKLFTVCPGSALSFQITGADADAGQIVSIGSTNLSNLPGGNATLTTTGTNPKTATFTWTPPVGTIGSYSVAFEIRDNACPINSVQTIGFRIDVIGVDITTQNIRYCQTLTPTTVVLNTSVNPTGGTYVWTPATGLSSPSIANPTATISSPITYIVTYTVSGCTSTDTFSAKPSVSTVSLTPTTATICAGASVPLTAQLYVDGVAQVSTCNYTLVLNDSYGDGWNGANLVVNVNGSAFGSYTLASGSTSTVTLAIPTGATIQLVYSSGSFESEVSYVFKNPSGTTLYSAGPSPATGAVYSTTASCTGIATYAWSPGTGLSATNINNPIATPTASNTYTVTASNAAGCSATASVSINVSNGTLNVTPVNPSICPGTTVQLNTNFSATPPSCGLGGTCTTPTLSTVGTATTNTGTSSTSGAVGSPYQGYYGDGRVQYLLLATELTAAGLKPGPISRLDFNVSSKFSTIVYSGFTIKMGCSSLTSLSSFVPGLSTVYSANVTATAGWNSYNFSTNYTWDGTSNLLVEVCYDNSTYTGYDHVFYTATSFNSVVYQRTDGAVGCTLASPTTSTQRPNMRFNNCSAVSYTWSPTTSLSASNITNPIATPTGTTTYNVTVQSGACTLTGSTTVTVAPAYAGPDLTVACYQTGSATMAATGSGTWTSLSTNPGTSVITTPTSATSTVTTFSAAGTYSYVWLSGTCSDTMNIVVGSTCGCTNPPTVSLSSTSASICAGLTQTVVGTFGGSTTQVTALTLGSGTFGTSTANASPFSYVYTPSVADIAAGTVTIKVVTNNPLGSPCRPDTNTFTLTLKPIPVINAGVDTLLNCTRTTLNLNATSSIAGTTYAWSNGTNTATNAVASPNTYTVTGTANGCTATDAVVVTQDITPPAVNAGIDTVLNCVRTSLVLQATSTTTGATFAWSNGTNTTNNTVASPNTYTVTATDPTNGCTASDAIVVTQNITPPAVNAGIDTVLNCVRTSLVLQATSTTTGATFAWSNGTNTANNTISTPNTYTVTATNPANGCTASDAVAVTQDITPPTVSAGIDTVLNCVRTSLILQATSNVTNATFAWSNGTNTANNTISTPNTYTVTATNPYNGCTASDAVVVTQDITPPTVNAGIDTVLNCVRTSLVLQATSNVTNATFVWSNGTNTANNTVASPNTYTVTATDPTNGCTASDAIVVTQNITPPTVNAGIDTVLNCVRTSLVLQATSTTTSATFAWSNGTNTANNTISTPNTYTVTATNPTNGCTVSDAVVVTQNITPPNVNAGIDTVLNCVRTSLVLQATSTTTGPTFAWSNGTNTANNTISTPNTYTVTATNPTNGCTASDAVVVTQNITPPTINAGIDTVLNCVRTSLVLQATSNVTNATFAWSNGTNTANNTVSSPNTYTVTATNPYNGCTASDAVVVTQDITPPTVNAGIDTVLNCVRTSLVLQATSTTTGATFAWSNGTNTANNTVSTPNTYTVTATNPANGCTASDAVVVTQNITPPNVNAGIDTLLNCLRTSLVLQATSTTTGATFAWSNGTNTANNTVSTPNTYTVTATNPYNGCTASDAVAVTQDITPPTINAGIDTVLNCVRTSLVLQATSTTTGATFAWSNGTNTGNNTVSTPNTYTVTATNPYNGCTASDAVVVTQNITPPTVNAGIDTVLNCVRTSLVLQATSTTTGATFAWSNGTNTANNTVSTPNTYTVTATNPANGCTASDAVVVTQNITPPNVNAGIDTLLNCVRTSLVLQATSTTTGATFAWSNGTNTANNTVSTPNTYTVTATNPYNGCTASDAVAVTQDITPPTINAGIDTVLNCVRTSLVLQATSTTTGATFAWSNGTNTGNNTVSTPNTYTVTATNPYNGCTASDAVVVTQNTTPPNANAGADQAISCTTATAILSGSSSTPGVSFAWSGPGIVSGGSTATPTINVVGTYTLTVTDLLNGCTASDVVDITPNVNTPDINAGPDQLLTCAITSVNLTATSLTPGVTFAWSNGAPTASTAVSTPNTYYVTATNTINGCLAVDQVDVLQDITPPTVNAGNDGTLTCTVTSISLTATSNAVGAGFAWSNGVNTATNTVTLPNTYTVTATSPTNGCTASDAVVVTQNITPPTINAGADALLTCVVTSINLSATSTVSGATFAWSNGINVSANTVTTPNTYAVTATDPTNGCTAADAVDVTQNTVAPNVSAGLDQILTCVNTSATLSGSSTTAGVNFAWSGPGTINNGTSAAATVNTAGTFTLLVTDPVNGCTASDNVNVTTNVNAPNVNAGPDQLLTCAVTTVTLNGSSSTPGATFAWSDGATTPSTSTSYPNTYSLTVTDAVNGCQSVDQVVVNQNITPPSVNAGVDTKLTCLITSVTLTASSGASGASFAWSDGATSSSTVVSSPNTYTVTATDPANGCTASDDVIVNIDGEPSMTIAIKDNPCPDVAKGFVIPSVTGGILPYHYNWSNGSTASGLTGLHGGQYDLTVTDGNGCTLTQSSTIVEGGSLSIANLTSVEINLGETIQLNPVVNGSTAPLSYTWTPPVYLSCSDCSNPTVYTVATIKYTLSVIDTNGCKAHDTVKITVIPDYQIYVPNAFTPNGDGFNDIFEIYGKKNLWKEMSMIIYNRWGEKVFDTNDSQFGWDGTFHGVLQNPQVYVYELRITFINGYAMPLQKGSITLIR